jgi:hypothetical protein
VSFSDHSVILLFRIANSPKTTGIVSAAPRHGECVTVKGAAPPCLDDLRQIARHEGDHLDAVRGNLLAQRPGNRATDERGHAQFRESNRFPLGRVVRQGILRLPHDSPRFRFDDENLPGYVEYGCDPVVPVDKSRFHPSTPSSS